MDRKIIKDQLLNLLESRALDPTVIPVDAAVHADDIAQNPRMGCFTQVAKMWSPPAILIDGQKYPLFLGQVGELLTDSDVEHKRLLAKHMLASSQAVFDDRGTNVRMSRDVDHFDSRAA